MRISIAMCTYNGASYVQQQLDSFVYQSRMPDELLVCDDGSSDETVVILEAFRERAPFDVRIYRNPERLGYVENFESAIARCTGDIIFLSDQDDVWLDMKIERASEVFLRHSHCLVVINDAEITDAELSPTGLTKIGQTRSGGSTLKNFVTGCCTSFRARFRDIVLPIPADTYTHDSWINRVGELLGARVVVEEVLQYLRRHGANASNERSSGLTRVRLYSQLGRALREDPFEYCANRTRNLESMQRRLEERRQSLPGLVDDDERIDAAFRRLHAEHDALRDRVAVLGARGPRRLVAAVRFLLSGRYRHFSGWKTFVRDCAL